MTTHYLYFERISHPGSGFKFPCDAAGNVDTSALPSAQVLQLSICRANRWQEFRSPIVTGWIATSESKARP